MPFPTEVTHADSPRTPGVKAGRGNWLTLDQDDAADIDRTMRRALRLLREHGDKPTRAFLAVADWAHLITNQVPESVQVSAVREPVSANLGFPLSSLAPSDSLSVEQAARLMDITPQHARRLIRRDELKASRAGGRGAPWRIEAASMLAWIDRRQRRHREALQDAEQPAARRTRRAA